MRPAFIRVMTNTTSVVRNGRLDRMRGFEHLSHILGYCQSHGVTVMFGDWGGSLMDARAGTVNRTLLDHAAAYVAWLVGEKGSSTNPTASGRRPTAISTCGRRP